MRLRLTRCPVRRVGIACALLLCGLAGGLWERLEAQSGDTAADLPVDRPTDRTLGFKPILVGTAFGAAVAIAAVNPDGSSAISDETLVPVGLLTGAVFGALVQAAPDAEMGFSLGWGAVRVGALRDDLATAGERRRRMGPAAWQTRLSLLLPSSGQWSVGPVLGVVSHSFRQVEQETRCGGFFGCISGDFVTSHSNAQTLNVGVLSRFRPGRPDGRLFATFGGGIGAMHLESSMGGGSAMSPYLEVGAGLSRAGALRALEAGARLQAADVGPSRVDLSGVFLRVHVVHGGPR